MQTSCVCSYYILCTACQCFFLQIAGVASAHELNDRKRFSGFFQTDATTEYIGPALQALAQEFRWNQVAIITQGGPPFQQVRKLYLY